jgi:CO/xanthine dehydrogenase Mo-binding subunit
LLRGKAQFVDDIKITNVLHVAFVRSPQAHAKIRSVSTAEACRLPGVKAIFTYEDLRPLHTRDRISLALPSAYPASTASPRAANWIWRRATSAPTGWLAP